MTRLHPPRAASRLAAIWIGLGLATAAPTEAVAVLHPELVASVPSEGDTLEGGPTTLRLVFSESVEPALAEIRLIADTAGAVTLEPTGDPGDSRVVLAAVPALAPGSYRVAWRIVSADGHAREGSYVFHVAGGPEEPGIPGDGPPLRLSNRGAGSQPADVEPAVGPVGTAVLAPLRGIALAALLALAGLLGFLGPASRPAHRRTVVVLAVLAPLLLGAHLAAWTGHAIGRWPIGPSDAARAITTTPGRLEAIRLGLAALALAATVGRRLRLAAGLAFLAVLVGAGLGHSMAVRPAWSVPAKAIHLAAVAAWLGGLLALVFELRHEPGVETAKRVSKVALVAVVAVAVTGALQALVLLPSLAALTGSTYGRLALVKLAGLAVLVGFGAYHRLRLLPALGEGGAGDRLRRSVRREIVVQIGVVLVAGWLAHAPLPPSAP